MESPVVQVVEGSLRGSVQKIANGEEILAFQGVPYAKPPLGDLRFKAPQPAESWQGIKECTKDGSPCINHDLFEGNQLIGSEDCLFLNIFTKSVKPATLKPVLVFIHGGAFMTGSNGTRVYGPDYLLAEDIVLVTINYRLGLLGFLSLEDVSLEIPGNAGLKDQALALQWVQKNIHNFGGDPKNVTIAGESAGSASVHYHVLSERSKGLFHKAILQSGVVLNPWANNCRSKDLVNILKGAGVSVKDEREGVQYLMKLSGEEVHEIQQKYIISTGIDMLIIGPVVEKRNPTAFITQQPHEMLMSGQYNKVPIMMGYCNKEGLLMLLKNLVLPPELVESHPKKKLEESLAETLKMDSDSDIIKELADNIKKVYFASGDAEAEITLYSDIVFVAGIMGAAQLHVITSPHPVYLYRFSADAGLNCLKKLAKIDHSGACHGDDIGYMFKTAFLPAPTEESKESAIVNNFVKLLCNFARTGNPTPTGNDLNITWKKVEKGNTHFLDISETLKSDCNPDPERVKLWLDFGEKIKAHLATLRG